MTELRFAFICTLILTISFQSSLGSNETKGIPAPIQTTRGRSQVCDKQKNPCAAQHFCLRYRTDAPSRCFLILKARGYCSRSFVLCWRGLRCVGVPKRKFCLPAQHIGKLCQKDLKNAYYYCTTGLRCLSSHPRFGHCYRVLKKGDSCGIKFNICSPGLRCTGPKGKTKCLPPVQLGKECQKVANGYLYCAPGLQCLSHDQKSAHCHRILKKGDLCDSDFSACPHGLKCAGLKGKRRCLPPVQLGQVCQKQKNGYLFCEAGVLCISTHHQFGHCKRILQKGMKCEVNHSKCASGLRCTGSIGEKKCLEGEDLIPGERCNPKRVRCGKHKYCVGRGNFGRCVRILGLYGPCNPRGYSFCWRGLTCNEGKCIRASGTPGARCTAPVDASCGKKLICVGPKGAKGKGRCIRLSKENGACAAANYTFCSPGLTCHNGICKPPLLKGENCGGKRNDCAKTLQCAKYGWTKRCVSVVGLFSECEQSYTVCRPGMHCVASSGNTKKCIAPGKLGSSCDSKYSLCASGLQCVNEKCQSLAQGDAKGVPLNGECDDLYKVCREGTYCMGYPRVRRCSFISREGGICGKRGYSCARNLQCIRAGNSLICVRVLRPHATCDVHNSVCRRGLSCIAIESGKTKKCTASARK